jgi:hypothetical protein
MKLRTFIALFASLALASSAGAVDLPGKVLKGAGKDRNSGQLKKNFETAFGAPVSPTCPYPSWSLAELLNFARVNHRDLYRTAIEQRLGGTPEETVRVFLYTEMCARDYPTAP